jgi:structural maintenance of chromosome 4
MRQGDLSDLIHVSPQYPKGVLDFCKVEVHFAYIRDDEAVPGGYTVIEGTECCFSREARKDKTSTYRVDGSPKSLKEMGALLRRKGIDLDHNRFLILQGEVESISQMKPKGKDKDDTGLLEYLEDIIGSNRLAPLIDEAFAKKNELDDQRVLPHARRRTTL